MAEILKERSELNPAFQWDLSSLYKTDEDWESALMTLEDRIQQAASYQGKLTDAPTIREFMDLDTQLDRLLSNLFCYANLRRSEDTRGETAQSMYARIYSKYVAAVSQTAFAVPEILSLPAGELEAIAGDDCLAPYRFQMDKLIRRKAHTLSAAEEQLLARFGEVFAAPGEIADNLQDADLLFDPALDSEGQEHEVTGSNYILLQTSTDRTLRKNAFESLYKGYRTHINTFAASYSGCVKGAVAEAAARHYESSRAMSMDGENIPAEVYDNLIATVRQYMPAMYRYERLRKRLMGLDELHYYDLYAPLAESSSRRYTYEEAQQIVLDAVSPLGEEYGDVVRGAFRDRWIDVYPNRGKSGGAFSSGTYDSNPYILLNYTGTLDSVSTIAHEMGHSLHTWHSNRAQEPQNADYTLFVAEVASTVNENLMIEQLLQKESDPAERMALLAQYLENFKGTVYRQTMFAEFEMQAHRMAEQGEALNPAALNSLYLGLIRDYFGDELVIDDEVQYEWARIPHFYRPFYVYKYATGYSTATALSEGIRTEGAPAVKRYLEFLSMGGSRYPLDELKHAGVDLTTPAPVAAALEKFQRLLEDAEETAAKLGK